MNYRSAGLGLLISWLWLLFLQGPLLELAAQDWSVNTVTLFLVFLSMHALTCFTVSHSSRLRKVLVSKHAIKKETFILLLISCLFILGPSFYPSFPLTIQALAVFYALLAGLFSAPLFILWMECYSYQALPQAAKDLAGSLCISSGLTIAVIYLPRWTAPLPLSFCLIGSAYFYIRATLQASAPAITISLPIHDFLSPRLIILIALLYIAGGSIFCTLTIIQEFPNFFYLSNLAYAGACLFSMYLLQKSQVPDLHSLFRPILPFIGLGFLLFPLLPGTWSWLPLSCLQIGVAFLDMYTWLLFSVLARSHGSPKAICAYGIGLTNIFIVGGNLLSLGLAQLIGNLSYLNVVCLIAGTICLVSTQLFYTSWLPPGIELTFSHKAPLEHAPLPAPPEQETPSFVASPEAIHDCYRSSDFKVYLTPREKQVLFLLARSYSYKTISEKLFISNNTVKYHVKNIYQKFAVTNRQDLLEQLFGPNAHFH